MPSGTSLNYMLEEIPDRVFDVGIAEMHGVVFSAGLAVGGYKPYVAIYSTFLQRGFDGIVHDVALQHLSRKTIGWNADPQHASELGLAFIHDHVVTAEPEVVGGGKAGGSGTDDRDLFAGPLRNLEELVGYRRLLENEPLDVFDGQ